MDELQKQILEEIRGLNARTEMVERLLTVLINDGKLHDIGGYVYGKTSKGDQFIILYHYATKMVQKVTRVYQQDFGKLPHFIPTKQFPPDSKLVEDNPKKTEAKKRGIYHNCKPFTIATYPGPMTNMGPEVRFHSTIRIWGEEGTAPPIKDPFKVPYKPVEQPPQEPEEEEQAPQKPEETAEEKPKAAAPKPKEEKKEAVKLGPMHSVGFKKVEPPTWSPRARQSTVSAQTKAMYPEGTNTETIYYGNKEEVPGSAGTRKIYWNFVEKHGVAPRDGQELKKFYEETKNENK